MLKPPPSRILALSLLTLAAWPIGAASADEPDEATKLFDKGMELMNAGRFAVACPAVERSHLLDPRPGTLFTLAECELKRGRIARAHARYDEYLDLFAALPPDKQAKQGERPKVARAMRDALLKRVPTIKVELPAKLPKGMVVERDDVPFDPKMSGFALPVEPGAHSVAASAPGMKPWLQSFDVPEGASIVVVVPALDASPTLVAPTPVEAKQPLRPAESTTSTHQVIGGVTLGVGIAGVVVGSVLGVMAKSRRDAAINAGHCQPHLTGCEPSAKGRVDDLISSGRHFADGSTATFVVGGAGITAGVIVLLTAPSAQKPPATAWRVLPVPLRAGAGGALEGSF